MGRVEIVTLTVGARAKEGKGGGGGEKKNTPARYHCSFGKLRTLANGASDWCGLGELIDACQSTVSVYCLFRFRLHATAAPAITCITYKKELL